MGSADTTVERPAPPAGAADAPPRRIGAFLLAMLVLSFIAGLGNAPALAETGMNAVFWMLLAAVAVLVPVALVSAELASGWPRAGGIYLWVSEAFGPRVGFVAMWFVWVSALVTLPGVFSTLVAAAVFVVAPGLDDSTWFLGSVGLVVGWAATLVTFLGVRATGIVTTIANLSAIAIPAVAIVGLGIAYLAGGHPARIDLSVDGVVPDVGSLAAISIAVSAYFTFAGGENAAQYVTHLRDPQRTFPRGMFLGAGLCLLVFVPVTIVLAVTVPRHELSLAVGVLQALKVLLDTFSAGFLVPVFAGLLTLGACAALPNLLAASAAGMRAAAADGHLPPRFARTSRCGASSPAGRGHSAAPRRTPRSSSTGPRPRATSPCSCCAARATTRAAARSPSRCGPCAGPGGPCCAGSRPGPTATASGGSGARRCSSTTAPPASATR